MVTQAAVPEGAARRAALRALERVETGDPVADAMRSVAGGLSPADRRLATQLVYGVLRHRRLLDWWIDSHRQGRLTPGVRQILRLGLFQAVLLDRIPRYAAVSAAVDQARREAPRAAGLVNAVLRRTLDDLRWPDDPRVRFSMPDWLADRWRTRWPDRWMEMLERCNETPPLTLRVRGSVPALYDELSEKGVAARPSPWFPEAIRVDGPLWLEDWAPFRDGRVYVQDESAMAVAYAADCPAGARILDMAAGLGGKTFHLLDRAAGSEALAVDLSAERLQALRVTARRLQVEQRVSVQAGDARTVARQGGRRFDCVVLDAPCSGLGVVRRRPDIRWRRRPEDLNRLAGLQRELADAAVAALKPGGVLIYSTCSVEPEETTAVAAWLQARHPGLAADPVAPHVPGALRPWAHGPWLIIPPGQTEADGFFIARWIWREGVE